MHTRAFWRAAWTSLVALFVVAAPAAAQYQPRPLNDPATGETWHIEATADWWMPTADMVVASESLGIQGSSIDLKRDLGVTDQRFPQLQLQLRPSPRHKFRFQYSPIKYVASATLPHDIVFNGIRYRLGLPVNSSLDWKTYRIGYEYDFVVKNRGFVGFIVEAKYTDVKVQLDSPLATEFARARGPIPALGGIGRVYVVPNISITGELTAFKIPDSIDSRYNAHYLEWELYGTVNFTDHIGLKGGFHNTDVGYLIKTDSGTFVLRGLFFGAVLRY
jgi:hypothetical protein